MCSHLHAGIFVIESTCGSAGYCLGAAPVCPHLCPKCLTLCFWQFAPIVQHFLIGGTLEDWAQSTAKECDIPF